MMHELTFTPEEIGDMATHVYRIAYLPPEVFDGPSHKDMCVSLKDQVYKKLRNAFQPELPEIKMKLSEWQLQILFICLKYSEYLTGQQPNSHVAGRIIMKIQPKLLHS